MNEQERKMIEDELIGILAMNNYYTAHTNGYLINEAYEMTSIFANRCLVNTDFKKEFYALFIESYAITRTAETIEDIDCILDDKALFLILQENNLYSNDVDEFDYDLMEYLYNYHERNEEYSNTSDDLMRRYIDCDWTYYEMAIQISNNDQNGFLYKVSYLVLLQFLHIKALMKIVFILGRYLLGMASNKELICMYENLSDSGASEEECMGELYPIYEKFYADEFDVILSYTQFYIVLKSAVSFADEIGYFVVQYASSISDFIESSDAPVDFNSISKYIACSELLKDFIRDFGEDYDEDAQYRAQFNFIIEAVLVRYYDEISLYDVICLILGAEDFYKLYSHDKEVMLLEQKRQRLLNSNISRKVVEDRDSFESVNTGEDFEYYLGQLYNDLGYSVSTTKTTGDQGADLILEKNGVRIVVQAKFYSSSVGNKAVQEVVSALKYYGASKAVVVTNNIFTKSAVDLAEANDVELVDGNSLRVLRKCAYGY